MALALGVIRAETELGPVPVAPTREDELAEIENPELAVAFAVIGAE